MLGTVKQHWALVIACALGAAILLFVVFRLFQDSRHGQLSSALRELRERERTLQNASNTVHKSLKKCEKLTKRGEKVPPSTLLAAKDALRAARETEGLLKDQVMVLRNTARTIILQDYPPKRHESMCRRYLGESRQPD